MNDNEILALNKVLVRDNDKLTHVCISNGTCGAGNSNTSGFSGDKYYREVKSFDGYDIIDRKFGFRITAIVEDILYVVVDGKVVRLQVGEYCSDRRSIAYDTYEYYSIAAVEMKQVIEKLDRGEYIGGEIDGKWEGEGRINYNENDKKGRKYLTAKFADGRASGEATIVYTDGGKYVGEVYGENPDGNGKYYFPDGEYLEGNFYEGDRNGRGFTYDKSGKLLGLYQCAKGFILNKPNSLALYIKEICWGINRKTGDYSETEGKFELFNGKKIGKIEGFRYNFYLEEFGEDYVSLAIKFGDNSSADKVICIKKGESTNYNPRSLDGGYKYIIKLR